MRYVGAKGQVRRRGGVARCDTPKRHDSQSQTRMKLGTDIATAARTSRRLREEGMMNSGPSSNYGQPSGAQRIY